MGEDGKPYALFAPIRGLTAPGETIARLRLDGLADGLQH